MLVQVIDGAAHRRLLLLHLHRILLRQLWLDDGELRVHSQKLLHRRSSELRHRDVVQTYCLVVRERLFQALILAADLLLVLVVDVRSRKLFEAIRLPLRSLCEVTLQNPLNFFLLIVNILKLLKTDLRRLQQVLFPMVLFASQILREWLTLTLNQGKMSSRVHVNHLLGICWTLFDLKEWCIYNLLFAELSFLFVQLFKSWLVIVRTIIRECLLLSVVAERGMLLLRQIYSLRWLALLLGHLWDDDGAELALHSTIFLLTLEKLEADTAIIDCSVMIRRLRAALHLVENGLAQG